MEAAAREREADADHFGAHDRLAHREPGGYGAKRACAVDQCGRPRLALHPRLCTRMDFAGAHLRAVRRQTHETVRADPEPVRLHHGRSDACCSVGVGTDTLQRRLRKRPERSLREALELGRHGRPIIAKPKMPARR